MSDFQEGGKGPSNKPKLPPVPKFNFYWIYGIIGAVFFVVMFLPHDVALKTTWFKVQNEMIMTNDIEKIVVVNKEKAEVTLKKESLKNDKFKELFDLVREIKEDVGLLKGKLTK